MAPFGQHVFAGEVICDLYGRSSSGLKYPAADSGHIHLGAQYIHNTKHLRPILGNGIDELGAGQREEDTQRFRNEDAV